MDWVPVWKKLALPIVVPDSRLAPRYRGAGIQGLLFGSGLPRNTESSSGWPARPHAAPAQAFLKSSRRGSPFGFIAGTT